MIGNEEIEKIYNNPLPATRTGLFYNTFPYPTKISPEAVAIYIATHTKPGDTVLDVFGGSGSTGLAALMCEYPTEKMISIAKKLGIEPIWGARNAIIYEIGKYGSYASNVMCNPPNPKDFEIAVKDYFLKAKEELGWLYDTKSEDGINGYIRHIIWSDVLICPKCQSETTYYDIAVECNPVKIRKEGTCHQCSHTDNVAAFKNKMINVYDELLEREVIQKERVPVLVYGQSGTNKWVRPANESDLMLLNAVDSEVQFSTKQAKKIEWGELFRSGYHKGISHLHHFYTKRNYFIMTRLWRLTSSYSPEIRDALRLVLLSYNAAHSTLMSRVVVKKDSKDFVLTSAQSGVLYISSLPVEKNIIIGTERKLKNFLEAFRYVYKCSGTVEIVNKSSEKLEIPNNTIDYVFTDPPFGDFIPYAEVNQINELWLDETTDRKHEVIISSSQNKNVSTYKEMMTNVFCEINRVLKKDGMATVVFNSSKTSVWEAVSNAFQSANLTVKNTSFLNKTQASFKQIVSEGSVQGDPVILLKKGEQELMDESSVNILNQVIKESIDDRNNNIRLIYSKYLTRCLERGVHIKIGAKEAYEYVSRRIGAL